MTRNDIIEQVAKEKVLEKIVQNISSSSLTADLQDLVQMVYLILLEYDESKIVELWEKNQLVYFISRIAINNYRSKTSAYYWQIRRHQDNSEDITGKDWKDED